MAEPTKQFDPIHVSPNSEFFIALCQYGAHSYVTLGVKMGDKTEVLAAVGKVAGYDSSACGFFFDSTDAFIKNERFLFDKDKEYEVAYKAYALTYQHYLQFLHYLQVLSLSQTNAKIVSFSLMAYAPTTENPAVLQWGSIEDFDASALPPSAVDLDQHAYIGLWGNTCRHSAVQLTKDAIKCSDLGNAVSSAFFQSPPLHAVFSKGKVEKTTPYFYVLPLPPTAFDAMLPRKFKIINQLYRRLDEIVLSEQNNPITIQKFNQLKDLYNHLTRDSKTSIIDVMNGVEQWEEAHRSLISTHRKTHWFSFQTATQKMFVDFHKEFAALRVSPESVSCSS